MVIAPTSGLFWLALLNVAAAQSAPERQVPPTVMVEVQQLENRFEIALADDCNPERCFAKGCAYVEHAVADRPRSSSLPGLGMDPGPSYIDAQEYLTRATCAFAYEESVQTPDVQALSRRLESKLSKGWMIVGVNHQKLQPLPDYLQEPPPPEVDPDAEEETEEAPEPVGLSSTTVANDLWTTLLPHFFWMIAVLLLTVAGTVLIWAWRRVGQTSIEDQMLLAELANGDPGTGAPADGSAPTEGADDESFVAGQEAAWRVRLDAMPAGDPDPEIRGLIRELLLTGDLPLLAKAVLRFPTTFPGAFPAGGEVASAKLELSDYLKTVDAEALPADPEFFRSLNRHALAATLATQTDAEIVRSLRDEFGAAGLVALIGSLSARAGALLFALTSATEQYEMIRLLPPRQITGMAEQLLRSNRMDPSEASYLFAVVRAARANEPRPAAPKSSEVSDRGTAFDAVGALSVLLPMVPAAERGELFGGLLQRFRGGLPAWYRGIFLADMLTQLSDEARVDLLLEIDVQALAAWLSVQDGPTRDWLSAQMPGSLRSSVAAMSTFPSRGRQLALAEQGRRDLARGFQAQLARAGLAFERVIAPAAGPTA